MNEILELNNSAVAYLQMGMFPDAHSLLTHAIRLIPRQVAVSNVSAASGAISPSFSTSVGYRYTWESVEDTVRNLTNSNTNSNTSSRCCCRGGGGGGGMCQQQRQQQHQQQFHQQQQQCRQRCGSANMSAGGMDYCHGDGCSRSSSSNDYWSSLSYIFPFAVTLRKDCSHVYFDKLCPCGNHGPCPRSVLWALWYNLALTYQLWSNEPTRTASVKSSSTSPSSSPSTSSIATAKRGLSEISRELYSKIIASSDSVKAAAAAAATANRCASSPKDKECQTLLLAVLNNQGFLMHDAARYDYVSHCFHRLQSGLDEMGCLAQDKEYWAFFHLNSLVMLQSHAAGAA